MALYYVQQEERLSRRGREEAQGAFVARIRARAPCATDLRQLSCTCCLARFLVRSLAHIIARTCVAAAVVPHTRMRARARFRLTATPARVPGIGCRLAGWQGRGGYASAAAAGATLAGAHNSARDYARDCAISPEHLRAARGLRLAERGLKSARKRPSQARPPAQIQAHTSSYYRPPPACAQ